MGDVVVQADRKGRRAELLDRDRMRVVLIPDRERERRAPEVRVPGQGELEVEAPLVGQLGAAGGRASPRARR